MSNKSEQLKEAIKTSIYRHLDNIEYEERSNDSVIDAIEDGINEAIDTIVRYFESPPAESEKIPEIMKGTEYDYMMQIKDLINNQHTMTPDWVIAHAMSIVGRAYSAGVDFVVETLELEKKEEE